MPQNKESRRQRAAELKAASDQLTTQQKLEVAYGRKRRGMGQCEKEIKRLERRLVAEHEAAKRPPAVSKAEQRRVEKAKERK